jgi:hypothetical protein
MKRSNKELGIHKVPIKYLGVVEKLIERGRASTLNLDTASLVGLLNVGRGCGAFRYKRGDPVLMKVKNIEIISVNDETFRIRVYDKGNNRAQTDTALGERVSNPQNKVVTSS